MENFNYFKESFLQFMSLLEKILIIFYNKFVLDPYGENFLNSVIINTNNELKIFILSDNTLLINHIN